MKIGQRTIGGDEPTYIIAELGVNHDGSVARALELVDAAARAGVDAIKTQLFRTDLLLSRQAKLAAYQRAAGEDDPVSMLRRLELSLDEHAQIVERAHERGVAAIVSIFSVGLVDEALGLPWDACKTASPDVIHRPLLNRLRVSGLAMIVSTGAATIEEVARAVEWLDGARDRLALLHCVSSYPVPDGETSLSGIVALREQFPVPVGYSDHSRGIEAGAGAVELGAAVLEKHLTLDRAAAGPDHAASLEPAEFGKYVELARAAHRQPSSSGDPHLARAQKRVLECELEVRRQSRQSLVSACPIAAGQIIEPRHLTIKRPGTGLEPWRTDEIIGRCAARAIEADVPIVAEDVA